MSTHSIACGSSSSGGILKVRFDYTHSTECNHTSRLNSKTFLNKRQARRENVHTSSRDVTRYATTLNPIRRPKIRAFLRYADVDAGNSLLSPSRKSLICVPEIEVHTLAQGLLWPGRAQSEYEETVYRVFPYVLNTQVAFVALRYLARALSAPHANAFAYTYYAPKFTTLLVEYIDAALELKRPEGTLEWEWENLDALVAQVFAEDYWYFGSATRPELVDWIWSKIVERVLRLADKFPETVAQLAKQTDVQRNLACGNLRALAIYPTLILRAAEATHGAGAGAFDACCASAERCPRVLEHAALRDLRANVCAGPDVMLAAILRACECSAEGDGYQEIDSVAEHAPLERYSRRLASFSASDDEETAMRAIHHMKIIASLDRYCFAAISDAVVNTSLSSQRCEVITQNLKDVAEDHKVSRTRERPATRTWAYRHRSTDDGTMHVRHGPAYSRRHPCDTCVARGTWTDWLAGPSASCEALVAEDDQLLWLYVSPEAPFDADAGIHGHAHPKVHHPVLVGVYAHGVPAYIASPGVQYAESVAPAFSRTTICTAASGAREVVYDGGVGQTAETPFFRVLVLRHGPGDDSAGGVDVEDGSLGLGLGSGLGLGRGFAEPPLYTPGVDATGPVYWREVWIDDDEDTIGSESTDAEFWCSEDTLDFNFKLG